MSTLLIVVVILVIFYTNRMQQNTSEILVKNVSNLKLAEELEIALMDMKGLTSYYILDGDEEWLKIFSEKQALFIKWFANAQQKGHSVKEKMLLGEINTLYKKYLKYHKEVVYSYRQGETDHAVSILMGDMRETFNSIYEKCEELLSFNEDMMNATNLLIEKDNRMINRITFAIGVLGILLGIVLGLVLARSITHPIYELVLKVKGATKEEFIEKIDISEETELEHLSKHVRRLIEKIHEVNKDLEQSQMMLIRSEKLATLGQMAAGLAHEIRNPLTAIKILIFTLQKESTENSQMMKDYAVILKEIDRMENFLQNFLTFARPPESNLAAIDINKIMRHTLNLLTPQIRNKKINLIESFNQEDAFIYGDSEQIQIVLANVILNAIQSVNDEGIIEIESEIKGRIGEPDAYIQIKITDNGTGISQALINSLFDPFVTSKEKGTGLGLFIVHQIIINHGGRIEAFNNSDKGATFIITLPCKGEK